MPHGPSRAPRPRAHRRAHRRAAVALVLPLVLGLGSCGMGAPRSAPPSGVDGLVVPTPSIEPTDFVAFVDNPWLPLAVGSRWRYAAPDGASVDVIVSGTRPVAGVEATVVDTVERGPGGRVVERSSAWFAQDREGNVWHVGDEGVWEAGEAGAEAGLAMPATPRVGDGFLEERAPGVAGDESRVLAVDARRTTSYDAFDGLVQVERSSPLEPGRTTEAFYARDVGLVLLEGSEGTRDLELVELSRG